MHPVAVLVSAVGMERLDVHGPSLIRRAGSRLCSWQVWSRGQRLAGMPQRWLLLDRDAVEDRAVLVDKAVLCLDALIEL
jgi:hypothetical protein